MFCTKCGAPNTDGAKFCTSCGQSLNTQYTAVNPNPQSTPPLYAQPNTPVQPLPDVPEIPTAPAVPQASSPAAQPYQTPAQTVSPVDSSSGTTDVQPPYPVYTQPSAPGQNEPVFYPSSAGKPLSYKIFGANLPAVSIRLDQGESIYTQSGGMTWMDQGIQMETNMKGGLMKGLGRMMSGESLFIATYTATRPDLEIVIASSFPGQIAAIDVSRQAIIAQKSAFLCAQPSVMLSAFVTKSIGAGLFGGEGFILQRIAGTGMAFLEIDGSLVERELAPGESIKVDTGNVAAFADTVQYQAEMVKGFKNVLFGGEGLFLTTLTGPGKVWLQTMTLSSFARKLIPFLPKSGN